MAEQTAMESFQKGYEAMGAVREDMASKDILSQVYAGQTPEDIKDPIKQAATLNQAAGMLNSKGLSSAAYKLQKQAGDLSTDVHKQQLDDLKVKQGVLEYAGQMLTGAATDSDLNEAFSGVKDTLAQAQIQRVIRMDVPFEKKKQMLGDMAKSVDQHLKAQQIAATAAKSTVTEDNIETDNLRQRLAVKDRDGLPKTAEEIEWEKTGILPKYQRAAKARGETIPVGESPKSIRLNNPLNLTDSKTGEIRKFDTYEEGAAAGKADLAGKLEGTSAAYKAKFGDKPVTPERLAETWAPAGAKGNSPETTANYAKKIADAAGIDVNKPIPNTPEIRDKVFNAMAAFEAGTGSGAKVPAAEVPKAEEVIAKWDNLNPVFKEKNKLGDVESVGVAFNVEPKDFVGLSQKKRDFLSNSYSTADKSEKVAALIANSPDAVGTLASIVRKAGGVTLNLYDNIAKNKDGKYTSEVAVLAKELFTMGLEDAQTGAGGRMNVFLEKSFANIYDPSLSASTLLDVLKDRENNSIRNITRTIRKADPTNLDKEDFSLYNSKSGADYLKEKGNKVSESKAAPAVDINSFFFSKKPT